MAHRKHRKHPPLARRSKASQSWIRIVDEIQREAYFIYEHRLEDGRPGSAESDWAAAERMVWARHAETSTPAP